MSVDVIYAIPDIDEPTSGNPKKIHGRLLTDVGMTLQGVTSTYVKYSIGVYKCVGISATYTPSVNPYKLYVCERG